VGQDAQTVCAHVVEVGEAHNELRNKILKSERKYSDNSRKERSTLTKPDGMTTNGERLLCEGRAGTKQ
jgi:hypothetical protein